jgi:hypothetical protein
MKKGLFSKKFSLLNEIKISLLTIIGFLVTIINPIAWIIYFAMYQLGKTAGDDKRTVKMASQWFSFIIAVLSYVAIIGYFVYKAKTQ